MSITEEEQGRTLVYQCPHCKDWQVEVTEYTFAWMTVILQQPSPMEVAHDEHLDECPSRRFSRARAGSRRGAAPARRRR